MLLFNGWWAGPVLILILTSFCGSAILHKDTLFIFRYPLPSHILPSFYPIHILPSFNPSISCSPSTLSYPTLLQSFYPLISYQPSVLSISYPPSILLLSHILPFFNPSILPYPTILLPSHILPSFNPSTLSYPALL